MKTCLLIDNESEAELINEFFVRANKISSFKLKKPINLTLRNDKVVQKLTKKAFVDIIIEDHMEQLVCYLIKLNVYTIILGNGWLQMHNPVIDWKKQTMKFNSADCMKKDCYSYDVLCIEFVIRSKLKNNIRSKKPTAVNPEIDIQPVNAKYFFCMARKKRHEGFL